MAELSTAYPDYTAALQVICNAKYGKAYVQCFKYRIFSAVMEDISHEDHKATLDDVLQWLDERPHTWRNIKARCKDATLDLLTLSNHKRQHVLSASQDSDYQVLRILLEGPLTPINLLEDLEMAGNEGVDQQVVKNALKLPATSLKKIKGRVQADFPASL
jgi:hypothetical protein